MGKLNLYCDESCHLEHDHEKVMVIGGISCPANLRKVISAEVNDIKKSYGISKMAEIKWNKVSRCNLDYFKAIVDCFFDNENLRFRAVVIDKTKLKHEKFHQTHNEFYYKMYYYCLMGLISPNKENYIYIDKKDTRGTSKIVRLKEMIANKLYDYNDNIVKKIQCVNSQEIVLVQLADLLIGAVGYQNRDINNGSEAKLELVRYIQKKSGYSLGRTTILSETKFNLFFIELK